MPQIKESDHLCLKRVLCGQHKVSSVSLVFGTHFPAAVIISPSASFVAGVLSEKPVSSLSGDTANKDTCKICGSVSDIHAVGLEDAQGAYMVTASYWNMNPDTRAWSMKFFEKTQTMPTMIQSGGYSAVLHYLRAVRDVASDDAAKVMARMRETPINDVFVKDGTLRADGRVIRDMYLARVKKPEDSRESWDYLDIVKTVKGTDAFRPVSESECPLLKN